MQELPHLLVYNRAEIRRHYRVVKAVSHHHAVAIWDGEAADAVALCGGDGGAFKWAQVEEDADGGQGVEVDGELGEDRGRAVAWFIEEDAEGVD